VILTIEDLDQLNPIVVENTTQVPG